jgi:hypothetical protein
MKHNNEFIIHANLKKYNFQFYSPTESPVLARYDVTIILKYKYAKNKPALLWNL